MFQGVFLKEESKGYQNLVLNELIKISNISDGASKLPQHSKFLEYPDLECLYLVIQVGKTDFNNSFGLPLAFVTQDNKLTSTLKPFWPNGAPKNCKIIPLLRNLSNSD